MISQGLDSSLLSSRALLAVWIARMSCLISCNMHLAATQVN